MAMDEDRLKESIERMKAAIASQTETARRLAQQALEEEERRREELRKSTPPTE